MTRRDSIILAVTASLAAVVIAPRVALADHDDWREHGWARGYDRDYGRHYGWGRGYERYRDYGWGPGYGYGRGGGWGRYDDDDHPYWHRRHHDWQQTNRLARFEVSANA